MATAHRDCNSATIAPGARRRAAIVSPCRAAALAACAAALLAAAAGPASGAAPQSPGPAVQQAVDSGIRHIRRSIGDTWSYVVTTVDRQPITVGTLVVALLLLLVGFVLSRRLSRALARTLTQRLKVDAGAAAAIETLGFYTLFAAFTLWALRTVNFPLTAFTILGGGLAIGIGFGSQNIMNNFISGLILMLERPVRAGDLVELEGTYGTVEHIGARSTRIRAGDHTQIIVPNSFFLEHNVVNWTLSDDVVRAMVEVGVVYGSPTRTVERLIHQVLAEHPSILQHPPPRILFAAFGDDALGFQAYFWIRARSMMERLAVESDVRFRIDDLFREAAVVIAFPQRDVHLDSARPLEVRLVSDGAAGATPS
jgi:potassium-dependent mechanosensitive channel